MQASVARFTRLAIPLIVLATMACHELTTPIAPSNAEGYRALPRAMPSHVVLDPTQLRPVFGPQTITRGKGAPETVSFVLTGFGPNAVLHVVNGDANGGNRATSGEITLDGTRIVSPSSFSKQVASFDVAFTIGNPSTLAVRLAGAPGSTITISVDAQLATSATVGTAGGTVQLLGTQAVLDIPAGAISGNLSISAAPVSPDMAQPANRDIVGGSTVEFGPDGTQFSQPIAITLAYDPANVPANFPAAQLQLGTLVGGHWVPVAGSSVDAAAHTVTGHTTHFSTYGVVAFGTFTQVTIGELHVCGLTASQDVYCWGQNSIGQLGTITSTTCTPPGATISSPCSTTPVLVSGGLKFVSISAADNRTCGVTVSADAYCWGSGVNGGLGDGDELDQASPVLVAGGLHWATVATGYLSSCGLTTTGAVYCWGSNVNGEVGNATTQTCTRASPTRPPTPCAMTPLPIASTLTFTQVSAGLFNGCAIATDQTAWCWGTGSFGVNGNGTTSNQQTPVLVAGGLSFSNISTGGLSACGVTTGAVGYCWGANSPYRMLGIGIGPNHSTPIAVSGGLSFSKIAANAANIIFEHNCGLTTTGEVWCWGGNDAQQLGSTVSNETCGTSLQWACQNVPVNIASGQTFRDVAVGRELTCVLGTDGQTYCMGNDTFGQIGDGTVSTSTSYTRVPFP